MAGIYKKYDIRGIYGEGLTEEIAYRIGRAFVTFLRGNGETCDTVVVARDIRSHSKSLFDALTRGLIEQGANVINLGEASTPMSYFANGTLGADASIMITASHNPPEWNGFKLCRANAEPISGETGIAEIEQIVLREAFAPQATVLGIITTRDVIEGYERNVSQFVRLEHPVHIAIDFANGMGIWEVKALEKNSLLTWDSLYDTPDGECPNHEANPLERETLEALQEKVRGGNYAFGVAFDGDADRAGFVDEKGEIITGDLITALIALDMMAMGKGNVFLYDVRCSWVVKEAIEAAGGTAIMCPVGHSVIKQRMREEGAVFAGEMSAHYYFKENFVAESQAMAILAVANMVGKSGKPLSELVAPLRKYHHTCHYQGEINIKNVKRDPQAILDEIRATYADGRQFELDGISVEYADWWFNVRCSNTELVVRLNLEAKTKELMEAKRDEVLAIIRK